MTAGYCPHSRSAGWFCDPSQICQVPKCSECPVFLQGKVLVVCHTIFTPDIIFKQVF